MPGIAGRVLSSSKGAVRVELTASGQIINILSGERFFIGDPVMVASEEGKIQGVTRASKKAASRFGGSEHYGEGLGEYWARGKQ